MKVNSKDKELLAIISKMKSLKSIGEFRQILNGLEECESAILNKEYRITIIGEFSSGKSTLLNALIGQDLLSHRLEETTAAVTYIHNVCEIDSKLNKQIVHFKNKKQPDVVLELQKESLSDYTSRNDKINVAADIESVDIYKHFSEIDYPIVLVDTPGLNGMAKGHRELTLNEMDRAHASICLFPLKGISKTDINTMNILKQKQNQFFFVVNGVDDLKDGETYEDRLSSFKLEVKERIFNGTKTTNNIFAISALNAVEARDKEAYKIFNRGKEATESLQKECLKNSHIEDLEKGLYSYLTNCDKELEFYDQMTSRLMRMLLTIKDDNSQEKKAKEVALENLPEKKILENKKVLTEKQLEKYRIKIENDINEKIATLNKELHLINDQKWVNVESEIEDSISKISSIDKAKETLKNNLYGKMLLDYSHNVSLEMTNFTSGKLNTIYNEELVDINGNLPTINFSTGGKIDITIPNVDQINDNVNIGQDHLNDLERQKAKIESELNSKGESETSKLKREINEAEKHLDSIEKNKEREIFHQGSRPEAEAKYKTKRIPRYEMVDDSGFFRSVGSFFGICEKKYKKECVGYDIEEVFDGYDDREGIQWDKNIREIESRYRNELNRAEGDLDTKRKLLNNAMLADKMKERLRSDIGDIEEQIRKEKIRQEQELAKKIESILNNVKGELKMKVEGSIHQLKKNMNSNIDSSLKNQKEIMITDLKTYYENEAKKQLSKIDGWIKDLENKGKNKETKERTALLESDLKNIENIEEQINKIA